MLIFGLYRCRCPKVYPYSLSHNCFAIENSAHLYRGIDIEEGDDDPSEGLERCPAVDWYRGVYEVSNLLEVICSEDLYVIEVCDEQRVGGRCW